MTLNTAVASEPKTKNVLKYEINSAKLKSVKLNKAHQIKFTLENNAEEFLVDIKDLLQYPAYKILTDASRFTNAYFDNYLIFWNLDCDIHINQLLNLNQINLRSNENQWVSAKKKSYYEYAISNWRYSD